MSDRPAPAALTYERGPTGSRPRKKEHNTNTTHTRTKALTAAVSAAIATMAAPALFVLGAGTAQATPDISARGPVGIIGDLPTPRGCNGCDGFNPQQDPAGYPDLLPALTHPDVLVGTHTGKAIGSGIGDDTASPAPEPSPRT